MGYSLPLNFVKVSVGRPDNRQSDVAVCVTRIVAMMSTDIHQARQTIQDERKAKTLINAAGIAKVKTAIFLDNGSVIASPLSVNRLLAAIEKANLKANPNITAGIKVYDTSHYDDDDETFDDDDLYDDDDDD